ncbi:spindle pole body associated protein [Gigaspora margarita]|uniref:Spindle pole body associated protein n=1 Tax=Gigaspora margarita TaxID=4874 RepID=A0A8H4EPQ3_GIGMA|nr:spindle pole body associated protein [Gigaspora margarita]
MSPITRSRTSLHRIRNPNFPTHLDLEAAYDQSVPRIQQDAKQYLEMILDSFEVRELYNPISEEYWFVNNSEALNMVVYYKMKKCLFIKYKQRFINAGLELEFMKNGGSGIGCNKIGCRNINCDAAKYHSDDDDSVICPNSLMYFDSDSYYPELDFSESSTPYLSRGISMSRTSSALSMIFPHFIPSPEKLSFKTDDSSSTILGEYVNVSFKTDDSSINEDLNNNVQSTEIHINPHLHHSNRSFHNFFDCFNNHINENFGTGVIKEIDGAVRAQVQEFVENEMFKINDPSSSSSSSSSDTEKHDDDLVGLVRKQLNEVIHEQLEKMMDGTSADYALYTGGARIIPHLTTRDYEAWPISIDPISSAPKDFELWGVIDDYYDDDDYDDDDYYDYELKGKYVIKVFDSTKKEFLVEATAKYENVAAILLANGADRFIDKFDNEVLDSLSPAINVIIVIGDASKLVDVKAATDNGVFVADTSLSSIKGSTKEELEKLELEVLNNLDFALITGVPKDPVNKIDEVSVIAADKAINYLNERGEIDLDVSDIQISLS